MRLDLISYAISRLSSYTTNPMLQHIIVLKHVLRYLSEMRSYGITYNDVLRHPNYFFGYADAAFANTDDQKSTISYVFMIARGAVTWYSK